MSVFNDSVYNDFYTEMAKNVLRSAEDFAIEMNSLSIGTEHLLYGLCLYPDSSAGKLLYDNGIFPDKVREFVESISNISKGKGDSSEDTELLISPALGRVIARCPEIAKNYFTITKIQNKIGTEHLLISLLKEHDCVAGRIMIDLGINPRRLYVDGQDLLKAREFIHSTFAPRQTERKEKAKDFSDDSQEGEIPVKSRDSQPKSMLAEYGRDLTRQAESGVYTKLIGRTKELGRLMQILSRKTKNNPCLVGEPGVGKTAIVEGFARLIATGSVPEYFKNKRIIQIDMSRLVAGTKFRGEFEERLSKLIDEVSANTNVILFIDEIHTIIGTGGSEGSLDAANILKPALSRGEVCIIGATTQTEYRKYFEKDAALSRRFSPVTVNEPDDKETLEILQGIQKDYELFHNIFLAPGVLEAIVRLSGRYINDRCQPDKSIDLLDEAASSKRLNSHSSFKKDNIGEIQKKIVDCYKAKIEAVKDGNKEEAQRLNAEESLLRDELIKSTVINQTCELLPDELTVSDIENTVSQITSVPVSKLGKKESDDLLHLEERLHERIVGQDEAVTAVSKAIRRGRTGLKDPKRPIGSFIFLGPTGVGKTELARALAQVLFGTENSLIRIDMSEYMEQHSVSKMVGSPPGYVGFDDGGQLTEMVRKNPYSVVLFDEVEKAHPDVFNILLQVLDDGKLTDTKGRTADFRNTVIIMTSNIGARNITKPTNLGFADYSGDDRYNDIQKSVNEELKKTFKPEFLNRVDESIVFKPLTKEQIYNIALNETDRLRNRCRNNNIYFTVSNEVINYLADKGFSTVYGARPIKRLIQTELSDRLAEAVLKESGKSHHDFSVIMREGKVEIIG